MDIDAEIAGCWRREADERHAASVTLDRSAAKVHTEKADRHSEQAKKLETWKLKSERALGNEPMSVIAFRPIRR